MQQPTVAARLSIQPGTTLWFEPVEWLRLLGPLPPGVRMTGEFAASTVAVLFVSNAGGIRWFLDRYRTVMARPPMIWLCYPSAGLPAFNRGTLVAQLAGHGLNPVGEVPLGDGWTAMQVRRTMPGPPPTTVR
jgi:hypothetical protein